jgi:predicted DNA binding CopG/RHH family protein
MKIFKQSYKYLLNKQNFCIFIFVKTKENKEVRLNIRIDKSLRSCFKQYCLENGLDMSKVLRESMEQIIKKANKCK